MNAVGALAEARRVRAEVLARNVEVDKLSAQLATHLAWMRENPEAVRNLLRRQPHAQQTKGNIHV